MKYTDPDGREQVVIQSKYTMQTGAWGNIKNTRTSISKAGCAIVGSANFSHSLGTSNGMSPSQINEKYVDSKGLMNFSKLGEDLGFSVTKTDGELTHDTLKAQHSDKNNIYLTLVNVNYSSDKSADHWVGVKGIETIDDTDYIRITPTSDNDISVSAGTLRGSQNWKKSTDETILVPVSETKGYVNFIKKVNDDAQ